MSEIFMFFIPPPETVALSVGTQFHLPNIRDAILYAAATVRVRHAARARVNKSLNILAPY